MKNKIFERGLLKMEENKNLIINEVEESISEVTKTKFDYKKGVIAGLVIGGTVLAGTVIYKIAKPRLTKKHLDDNETEEVIEETDEDLIIEEDDEEE